MSVYDGIANFVQILFMRLLQGIAPCWSLSTNDHVKPDILGMENFKFNSDVIYVYYFWMIVSDRIKSIYRSVRAFAIFQQQVHVEHDFLGMDF